MTHRDVPFARLLVAVMMILATLACSFGEPGAGDGQDGVRSLLGVAPTLSPALDPAQDNQAPAGNSDPAPWKPPESVAWQAADCDRMSFIEISPGATQVLTFSQDCQTECAQGITFKNTHPSERLMLIFFETKQARPDQPGWTGERWTTESLDPGQSVKINQGNRTPHTDACPWSTTDYSLVGAIPLGLECQWVESDPGTSLLPLKEVENQCR